MTTTIESKTNFLAAIPVGHIARVECTPLHHGKTTMVWQTKVMRGDGCVATYVTYTQLILPSLRVERAASDKPRLRHPGRGTGWRGPVWNQTVFMARGMGALADSARFVRRQLDAYSVGTRSPVQLAPGQPGWGCDREPRQRIFRPRSTRAFSGKVVPTFPVRKRDISKTCRAFSDYE